MPLIFYIADWLLTILIYMVLADCIMSWFAATRNSTAARLIQTITNPLLMPFRLILPSLGGLDLSPFLAVLLLTYLQNLLHKLTV
jgi:YggT family protein